MWVRIDDRLPRHPKIAAAGLALGRDGISRALACFLTSLCYAAEHLTDGVISVAALHGMRQQVWNPVKAAEALADAGLFERIENGGGYRIHDYHDYNPSAAEVKADREWDRRRKELYADPGLVQAIKTRDVNCCRYCGVAVSWTDRRGATGGQFDHVQPRGESSYENVVVACRRCNTKKGGRTPEQAGLRLRPVQNQDGTSSRTSSTRTRAHTGDGTGRDPEISLEGEEPEKGKPLVPVATGPHRTHASCGRPCVPASLHEELVRKRGGDPDRADADLRAFYGRTMDAWEEKPLPANDFDFWRQRYDEAFPGARPPAMSKAMQALAAGTEAALARRRQHDRG